MVKPAKSELVLIRHAPAETKGRLCGRRDVPARIGREAPLEPLRRMLACIEQRVASPALRCRQTAEALWPASPEPASDARLWEQDFGEHDGLPFDEVPDLGPLDPSDLAAHRPPNGESFDDMLARVRPALTEWADVAMESGPVAIVAHAGTARAALALAMGNAPAALSFDIAPLSVTRLHCHADGLSVICTNWTAG